MPSKIAYLREDTPTARANGVANGTAKTLWGYEVKPSPLYVSYSWTKLLLDQQPERPDDDDTSLNGMEERGLLRLPPGKRAVDVVTDYLRHFYEHCMMTVERHYGHLLEVTPIEFWFTMPAIWSDQAQSATRLAAKDAGFGSRRLDTIHMITEPEAGVLAAMKTQVLITRDALEVRTYRHLSVAGHSLLTLPAWNRIARR